LTSSCSDPTPPGVGGSPIWRVSSVVAQLPLVPVANQDRSVVYFPTSDNRLKKIRGNDGHLIWDVSTGVNQPVIPRMNAVLSAGVVALSRIDIVAFDTITGVRRWKYVAADKEETGDNPLAA